MHYENFYIIILFNAYIRYHKKFKINVTTFDYNDNITRWWRQKKKKKKKRKKKGEEGGKKKKKKGKEENVWN